MAGTSDRVLRSRTASPSKAAQALDHPSAPSPGDNQSPFADARRLPAGSKLPAISASDLRLLQQKQTKLRSTAQAPEAFTAHVYNALSATLIFAQYEAGTAVCVDPGGWILTCAHCFGDDEAEIRSNMPGRRWLLTYAGAAVLTECRAWDTRRDLALLKPIAVETTSETSDGLPLLSHVNLASIKKMYRVPVFCVGQPGRDDLESTTARKTTYDLFEVSYGLLRGLLPGIDPQDNSEIGALKHDAWTYWGHSGAPLLREDDGTLVALHSSWDDQTAMRHAVPLVAIEQFLQERLPAAKTSVSNG